ncbi:hypothetical protein ACNI65_05615 [Roseateles sp. So40a]|uniref:hypothetical protein n=1 Tax=Roseateles sp. So40a TaxID=3400226 RepID=UPI003A895FEA
MPDSLLMLLPLLLYVAPIVVGLSVRRPAGWGVAYQAALLLPLVNLVVVVMALALREKQRR